MKYVLLLLIILFNLCGCTAADYRAMSQSLDRYNNTPALRPIYQPNLYQPSPITWSVRPSNRVQNCYWLSGIKYCR